MNMAYIQQTPVNVTDRLELPISFRIRKFSLKLRSHEINFQTRFTIINISTKLNINISLYFLSPLRYLPQLKVHSLFIREFHSGRSLAGARDKVTP